MTRPSAPPVIEAVRGALTPALGALLLFQVFSGILVAPLLTLFPVYVERRLGLPPTVSANVQVLSGIAGGVMALAGGALCDLVGRKRTYLLAMSGVLATGLIFLTHNLAQLSMLALYGGLMFGLGAVAGLTYVMETAPPKHLALATGSYFLCGTLGNAAGSWLAGWAASRLANGYSTMGMAVVGCEAVLILAAWRLLPDLPRPDTPRTFEALLGGYSSFMRRPAVLALLALRFLPTVYWGCVTFLMSLLLYRLTGSEEAAGQYTGASLIVSAVCQVAAGRTIDRLGVRAPALLAITLVTAASLGQGLFTGNVAALIAWGLLGAGAAWTLSITMTTLVQSLSTDETRAKLLSMTHVAWSAGFLTGKLVSGYLARTRGIGDAPLAFLVCSGCCALAIGCALVVLAGLRAECGVDGG